MSTEVSTHLISPELSDELIANESWSIDTYADGLMDDLFADIDQILDGRAHLQSTTVQGEYLPVKAVKMPQIVVQQATQPAQPVPQNKNKQLNTVVVSAPTVKKVVKKRRTSQNNLLWFGKLITVGATIGAACFGAFWLLNSGIATRIASKSTQHALSLAQSKPEPTKPDVQGQLVEYMLGSLATIERQQQAKATEKSLRPVIPASAATVATLASAAPANAVASRLPSIPPSGGTLPQPLAANSTPPASPRSTTIVERIYIPVYQAPAPMRYNPPNIAGIPANRVATAKLPPIPGIGKKPAPAAKQAAKETPSSKENTPIKTALNQVRRVAKQPVKNLLAAVESIKPVPVRSKPITLAQPKPPILPSVRFSRISTNAAPPKLPQATASAPRRQQVSSPAPVPVAQPPRQEVATAISIPDANPTHTLEGLLESGEKSKSTALFRVDGVSRHIAVGETIGASGWTLVDVAKGEAVIRRNGEVRSIFAGQKF